MSNYVLDRAFPIENGAESVTNIKVQDELEYAHLAEGIHIEGKINVTGEYIKSDEKKPFKDTMDVDIFLPIKTLNDCRNIKLFISDFNYQLVDDQLVLKVVYDIQKDECVEQFSLEDQIKGVIKDLQNDPNPFINKMRESISKEDSEMLEKALNGDFSDLEIISTNEEESEHPYIDLSEKEEIIVEDKNENIQEDLNEVEPDNNVCQIQEEAVIEAIPEVIEKEKTFKSDALFRKETYTVFATFYKCHDGDSYSSLAEKFKIDVSDLVLLNNNKPIEEGTLIQIKR